MQGEIQDSAYKYQRAIEEGRQIVVGVNKFQTAETESPETFRIDPELEREQVERLRAVRAVASTQPVKRALQ